MRHRACISTSTLERGRFRLGVVADSVRRSLSCREQQPDDLSPWVVECYGDPDVELGFDANGNLSYVIESIWRGRSIDAREVWHTSRQHYVEMLGQPDTVTGARDEIVDAPELGNKLYAFWSRPDVGDCAKLEVMSAIVRGAAARTVLTVGPCAYSMTRPFQPYVPHDSERARSS